jgi:hypothetical protein
MPAYNAPNPWGVGSMRVGFRDLFVYLAILAAVRPVRGQVLYGSVVGTIQDQSGAVIPNATITLTSKQTGVTRESVSDSAGRYSLVNMLPGAYDLKVSATGFRTYTQTDVDVSPNIVTRVNVELEVGQITEQVTVEAAVTLLQTDKSDVHSEINAKQVQTLPLANFRNYQSLINLVPGATPTAFQNSITDTPQRALTTNINGTNRNNNTTRIDGAASVNLWLPHHAGYVNPEETIETVNVTTGSADAEQGLAGGAAITVITKSGTNDFHGSAFEFHDNQHLYARNFFQAPGVNKPVATYNNYGGTVGGPIKKNKLFFFQSWDGTRQHLGAVGRYSVPTADQRTGDFSAYSSVIYDPATGNPATGAGRTPFPGNRVPSSRFNPISQKIQGYYPAPNLPGTVNNFFASASQLFHRDYLDTKINYNRSEKHAIWGKYGRMWATVIGQPIFGVAGGPAPGADPGTGHTLDQISSIGHTYTVSPSLLLDGVVGYQRHAQYVIGSDYGKNYGLDTLGISGTNGPDVRQSGFPNIQGTGYTSFGVPNWMPLFRVEESWTTSHNLTWTHSGHEVRFGYDLTRYRMNHWQPELSAGGPRGLISFQGGATALSGGASPNQYNSYAAFLMGLTGNVQKGIQYILMTTREWQMGWYARDRWQVTRNLTVNLGLRYEYYPLMTRAGKGIERLDPETNLVYLGGRGNQPDNVGITVSHKLFAPRLGIAYRLQDKTVIRTGYGLNYDPLPFSRPLRGFYPLTINFNLNAPNSFVPLGTVDQGIPPVVGPDLSSGVVPLPGVADERSPYAGLLHRGYTQSWNFTIERRLPLDLVTSVAYVGTESTHLLADRDINTSFPGGGTAGRPYYQKFGRSVATNMWDGYLSSNYHSLQVALNRQFSRGLMLKGAYTFSKAIDMADDDGWTGVTWNYGPVFYRNRARSGFDRTHIFQIGWVYELPFGKGKGWARTGPASIVLGHWQVNGIMAAYTGTPFTVGASGASLNAPGNGQTADQVNPVVERFGKVGPGQYYYDPKAFAPVTAVRFGSSGRNLLRNPGVWNTDLSIFRTFPIREGMQLQFRTEFFNFPNTSHFNGPSSSVANVDFMQITSSYGERRIRFGLRLQF